MSGAVMTVRSRFSPLFAGLLVLMGAGTPAVAWDPGQAARESIIQSVRDDVRRRIQEREQMFRNSRAEVTQNNVHTRGFSRHSDTTVSER